MKKELPRITPMVANFRGERSFSIHEMFALSGFEPSLRISFAGIRVIRGQLNRFWLKTVLVRLRLRRAMFSVFQVLASTRLLSPLPGKHHRGRFGVAAQLQHELRTGARLEPHGKIGRV